MYKKYLELFLIHSIHVMLQVYYLHFVFYILYRHRCTGALIITSHSASSNETELRHGFLYHQVTIMQTPAYQWRRNTELLYVEPGSLK